MKDIRIYVRHTITLTQEQYAYLKKLFMESGQRCPIEDFMIQYITSIGSYILNKEIENSKEKEKEKQDG